MRHLTPAIAAIAAFCAATGSVDAQDSYELDQVVVSGGLIPIDAQSYARANTILTAPEIERRQLVTLADALRQMPGVQVSRVGGRGGETSIRIRGSENNHVLVLIDGVETADSSQFFEFANIGAEQIERIEVLRGPQSALYGAGATAGVINILTKGGIRNGGAGSFSVEGGSGPSRAFNGVLQGGSGPGMAALSISYRDDEGYDVSGNDGEKDGLRNLTLNFKGSADLSDSVTVRATGRFTDRTTEFDDTAFGCGSPDCYIVDGVGEIDGYDLFGSFSADVSLFDDRLVLTPFVGYSQKSNDITAAFGPSHNEGTTLKLAPKAALYLDAAGRHALIGSVDYRRETFLSSFAGNDRKERSNYGYTLEYQGDVTDALFVQAGLRFDDNDEFEDALAWSASASYSLPTGTRLRAAIGQAQTNPTFFEQFGFIPGQFTGNPDLKPEENFGWEIGIDQTLLQDRLSLGVTWFDERLTDEIANFGPTVDNLDGESTRQGIEVSLTARPLPRLSIGAAYTYLDAEEPDGGPEVRRPRHSGGLNIAYSFLEDRARLGADLTWFGDNHDRDFSDASFTSPIVEVDGYVRLDLNASYQVNDNLEVFGTLKNALDDDTSEVLGFAPPPRAAYLGLRASF